MVSLSNHGQHRFQQAAEEAENLSFILRQAQDEVEDFQRVVLMVSLSNHGSTAFRLLKKH